MESILNKTYEIEILSLASTGAGVGKILIEGHNRPVFVHLTVPGDIVKVSITKENKKYYEGDLVEIVKESPHRIKPICEFFGECGGCNWLNMDYELQIKSKEQVLSHILTRNGIRVSNIKIIPAKEPLYYRDKIRMAVKDKQLGFHKRNSNELVYVDMCHIANKAFKGIYMEHIKEDIDEISFGYDYRSKAVKSRGYATYYYNELEIAYFPDSFVQSNLGMNTELITEVISNIKGNVLELYCGNGNFTIPMASKAELITAVEGNRGCFRLLVDNLANNQIKNVKVVCDDVKIYLDKIDSKFDYIILDPPRVGASEVIDKMSELSDNIIYVSCSIANSIKDIKKLLANGYKISKIVLIDMFAQTPHFENVIFLRKY